MSEINSGMDTSITILMRPNFSNTHSPCGQLVDNAHNADHGLTPILYYVYAEPECWPKERKPVEEQDKARHREEIEQFTRATQKDEVRFIACPYRVMLKDWSHNANPEICAHAAAVLERFAP